MAKTIPTAIILPQVSRATPSEDVIASDWREVSQALHYAYSRQGSHIPGPVFDHDGWLSLDFGAGGNVYHTENQAPAAANYDLDDWQGVFRFRRPMHDTFTGADAYSIRFDVYARNLDVRATLIRIDTADGNTATSTVAVQLPTTHAAADSEWQSVSQTVLVADASRGGVIANGLAWYLVYVEAKVPAANTGQLWTWALRETPITLGTELPRGI